MTPTLGRIVLYKLSASDVIAIRFNRHHRNVDQAYDVKAGHVLPAIVVAKWGDRGCVNLRVFLDGDDLYWATSRLEDTCDGSWRWPVIEKPAAPAANPAAKPKKEDVPPAK